MPLLRTPAIVLKSRRWGEADRIVTFFTLKYGKVRGVARGARRMKSRFGSALEPFVHCDLELYEKHGDTLYRVSQADMVHAFPRIRESLERIAGAARLVNLAGAVTADGDAVPLLFQALLEGLRAVGDVTDPDLTVALYELEILRFAGYLPRMDRCNACRSRESGGPWYFSPRAGGTICPACVRREPTPCPLLSPACLALFRQVLRMSPAFLSRLKTTASVQEELHGVIQQYVESVAGRRLPRIDAALLAAEQPSRYRRGRLVVSGSSNPV